MSSDFFYASPRHVTAGTVAILIGGPANLFKAVGVWRSRFRAEAPLINDAARLLADCRQKFPAAQVRRPSAAVLRKRLALIKFVPALGSGRKNDAFRFEWREGKNNLS